MRRLIAATVLLACDPAPAPACADGQQNPCMCVELGGTQTCAAGKYSACDCSVAKKAITDAQARMEAQKRAREEASANAEAEEQAAAKAHQDELRKRPKKSDGNDPLSGLGVGP